MRKEWLPEEMVVRVAPGEGAGFLRGQGAAADQVSGRDCH